MTGMSNDAMPTPTGPVRTPRPKSTRAQIFIAIGLFLLGGSTQRVASQPQYSSPTSSAPTVSVQDQMCRDYTNQVLTLAKQGYTAKQISAAFNAAKPGTTDGGLSASVTCASPEEILQAAR